MVQTEKENKKKVKISSKEKSNSIEYLINITKEHISQEMVRFFAKSPNS